MISTCSSRDVKINRTTEQKNSSVLRNRCTLYEFSVLRTKSATNMELLVEK
jgi:hypothetical protein